MKPGTRIETTPTWPGVLPERARILKPRAENLPLPDGYHVVQFDDGGKLCLHTTHFRVIDNRHA